MNNTTGNKRRIVIVGGGIAGAEAALTLAIGLDDVDVTLVSRWPSIRISPDLVYVPFGISPRRIDVPIEKLTEYGVTPIVENATGVDVENKVVTTEHSTIDYDVLIVAPGAESCDTDHTTFRVLDDARRVQSQLDELFETARSGYRQSIIIRAESDDSWPAPATELALLLGTWVRSHGLDSTVSVSLLTTDRLPFEWFDSDAQREVTAALERAGVKAEYGLNMASLMSATGDLVISFGRLRARVVDGLPGHDPGGWYRPDSNFLVHEDIYVVGDAIHLPYRAAFATAWQIRMVLKHLGGDVSRLGSTVDDIPVTATEYEMDLGDAVLRARIPLAKSLGMPFLGHEFSTSVETGARPIKLAGLLLHDRLISELDDNFDVAQAYRDAVKSNVERLS